EVGRWKLGVGSWALEVGSWELDVGSWELDVGSWELGVGSWKLEVGSWELGVGSWALWSCRSPATKLSPSDPYPNPRRGAERGERLWPDRRPLAGGARDPARARRDDQLRLDHRKLIADAPARPCPERDVRTSRPLGLALRREASGIEPVWIGPQRGPAMDD